MKAWPFTLVLALATVVAACQGAERSGNIGTGPGGPDAMPVMMVDSAFEPDALELQAGAEVTIEVTNDGDASHDFTIDSLDLSTGVIEPGGVMTATLTVPDGPTEFRCTIHGGMRGEIVGA
ncbi:MAG: cupredoxin domain-containing protein [Actinomycetota bacterium]